MSQATVIERATPLPFPAEAVYAWHERSGAFERLVPPWDRVEVLERSGGLADGTTVRLRVHRGPLAVEWVARHRDVVPGRQFVDEQVEGPFASWVHTHQTTPSGRGSCVLTDRIEYRLPCGPLGDLLGAGLARREIERMLAHRHQTVRDDLTRHAAAPGPLTVAVTGASGLLGRSLVPFLTTGGHRVVRLVRRTPGPDELGWDPEAGRIDAAGLERVDAVVHLAGESIAGGRWTTE
ncbi:MAG: Cell division inhibitor, partial [Gemmatimonadetes bacterium]|nr:Cell division inhibitor [Gemmatimonadota bacterium]